MKNLQVALSAFTAFVIGTGGSILVVLGSGNTANRTAWVLACVVGAVTAAKDIRAVLSLPPINGASIVSAGDTGRVTRTSVIVETKPPSPPKTL